MIYDYYIAVKQPKGNKMKHEGNLRINNKHDAGKYSGVTEVTGDLYVRADFSAPLLASVGGYLSVRAEFSAPLLASVGGDLYVRAEFSAPLLASVGGFLHVSAEFSAPLLASVGGFLYVYADFSAPMLASVGSYLYVRTDFSAPMLASAYGAKGKLLSVNKYGLWKSDEGLFYAGCKRGFTKDEAIELSKTWEEQEIAQQFIAAILNQGA
jgi:hypothetical protein